MKKKSTSTYTCLSSCSETEENCEIKLKIVRSPSGGSGKNAQGGEVVGDQESRRKEGGARSKQKKALNSKRNKSCDGLGNENLGCINDCTSSFDEYEDSNIGARHSGTSGKNGSSLSNGAGQIFDGLYHSSSSVSKRCASNSIEDLETSGKDDGGVNYEQSASHISTSIEAPSPTSAVCGGGLVDNITNTTGSTVYERCPADQHCADTPWSLHNGCCSSSKLHEKLSEPRSTKRDHPSSSNQCTELAVDSLTCRQIDTDFAHFAVSAVLKNPTVICSDLANRAVQAVAYTGQPDKNDGGRYSETILKHRLFRIETAPEVSLDLDTSKLSSPLEDEITSSHVSDIQFPLLPTDIIEDRGCHLSEKINANLAHLAVQAVVSQEHLAQSVDLHKGHLHKRRASSRCCPTIRPGNISYSSSDDTERNFSAHVGSVSREENLAVDTSKGMEKSVAKSAGHHKAKQRGIHVVGDLLQDPCTHSEVFVSKPRRLEKGRTSMPCSKKKRRAVIGNALAKVGRNSRRPDIFSESDSLQQVVKENSRAWRRNLDKVKENTRRKPKPPFTSRSSASKTGETRNALSVKTIEDLARKNKRKTRNRQEKGRSCASDKKEKEEDRNIAVADIPEVQSVECPVTCQQHKSPANTLLKEKEEMSVTSPKLDIGCYTGCQGSIKGPMTRQQHRSSANSVLKEKEDVSVASQELDISGYTGYYCTSESDSGTSQQLESPANSLVKEKMDVSGASSELDTSGYTGYFTSNSQVDLDSMELLEAKHSSLDSENTDDLDSSEEEKLHYMFEGKLYGCTEHRRHSGRNRMNLGACHQKTEEVVQRNDIHRHGENQVVDNSFDQTSFPHGRKTTSASKGLFLMEKNRLNIQRESIGKNNNLSNSSKKVSQDVTVSGRIDNMDERGRRPRKKKRGDFDAARDNTSSAFSTGMDFEENNESFEDHSDINIPLRLNMRKKGLERIQTVSVGIVRKDAHSRYEDKQNKVEKEQIGLSKGLIGTYDPYNFDSEEILTVPSRGGISRDKSTNKVQTGNEDHSRACLELARSIDEHSLNGPLDFDFEENEFKSQHWRSRSRCSKVPTRPVNEDDALQVSDVRHLSTERGTFQKPSVLNIVATGDNVDQALTSSYFVNEGNKICSTDEKGYQPEDTRTQDLDSRNLLTSKRGRGRPRKSFMAKTVATDENSLFHDQASHFVADKEDSQFENDGRLVVRNLLIKRARGSPQKKTVGSDVNSLFTDQSLDTSRSTGEDSDVRTQLTVKRGRGRPRKSLMEETVVTDGNSPFTDKSLDTSRSTGEDSDVRTQLTVKRGRGWTRKSLMEKTAGTDEKSVFNDQLLYSSCSKGEDSDVRTRQTVKRGRGRPRKSLMEEKVGTDENSLFTDQLLYSSCSTGEDTDVRTQQTVKGGRGRPRKSLTEKTVGTDENSLFTDQSLGSSCSTDKDSDVRTRQTLKRGRGRPRKSLMEKTIKTDENSLFTDQSLGSSCSTGEDSDVRTRQTVKRGRGRPRKSLTEKTVGTDENSLFTDQSLGSSCSTGEDSDVRTRQTVKRGRGRPRTSLMEKTVGTHENSLFTDQSLGSSCSTDEDSDVRTRQTVKRGRGRPRKSLMEKTVGTDENSLFTDQSLGRSCSTGEDCDVRNQLTGKRGRGRPRKYFFLATVSTNEEGNPCEGENNQPVKGRRPKNALSDQTEDESTFPDWSRRDWSRRMSRKSLHEQRKNCVGSLPKRGRGRPRVYITDKSDRTSGGGQDACHFGADEVDGPEKDNVQDYSPSARRKGRQYRSSISNTDGLNLDDSHWYYFDHELSSCSADEENTDLEEADKRSGRQSKRGRRKLRKSSFQKNVEVTVSENIRHSTNKSDTVSRGMGRPCESSSKTLGQDITNSHNVDKENFQPEEPVNGHGLDFWGQTMKGRGRSQNSAVQKVIAVPIGRYQPGVVPVIPRLYSTDEEQQQEEIADSSSESISLHKTKRGKPQKNSTQAAKGGIKQLDDRGSCSSDEEKGPFVEFSIDDLFESICRPKENRGRPLEYSAETHAALDLKHHNTIGISRTTRPHKRFGRPSGDSSESVVGLDTNNNCQLVGSIDKSIAGNESRQLSKTCKLNSGSNSVAEEFMGKYLKYSTEHQQRSFGEHEAGFGNEQFADYQACSNIDRCSVKRGRGRPRKKTVDQPVTISVRNNQGNFEQGIDILSDGDEAVATTYTVDDESAATGELENKSRLYWTKQCRRMLRKSMRKGGYKNKNHPSFVEEHIIEQFNSLSVHGNDKVPYEHEQNDSETRKGRKSQRLMLYDITSGEDSKDGSEQLLGRLLNVSEDMPDRKNRRETKVEKSVDSNNSDNHEQEMAALESSCKQMDKERENGESSAMFECRKNANTGPGKRGRGRPKRSVIEQPLDKSPVSDEQKLSHLSSCEEKEGNEARGPDSYHDQDHNVRSGSGKRGRGRPRKTELEKQSSLGCNQHGSEQEPIGSCVSIIEQEKANAEESAADHTVSHTTSTESNMKIREKPRKTVIAEVFSVDSNHQSNAQEVISLDSNDEQVGMEKENGESDACPEKRGRGRPKKFVKKSLDRNHDGANEQALKDLTVSSLSSEEEITGKESEECCVHELNDINCGMGKRSRGRPRKSRKISYYQHSSEQELANFASSSEEQVKEKEKEKSYASHELCSTASKETDGRGSVMMTELEQTVGSDDNCLGYEKELKILSACEKERDKEKRINTASAKRGRGRPKKAVVEKPVDLGCNSSIEQDQISVPTLSDEHVTGSQSQESPVVCQLTTRSRSETRNGDKKPKKTVDKGQIGIDSNHNCTAKESAIVFSSSQEQDVNTISLSQPTYSIKTGSEKRGKGRPRNEVMDKPDHLADNKSRAEQELIILSSSRKGPDSRKRSGESGDFYEVTGTDKSKAKTMKMVNEKQVCIGDNEQGAEEEIPSLSDTSKGSVTVEKYNCSSVDELDAASVLCPNKPSSGRPKKPGKKRPHPAHYKKCKVATSCSNKWQYIEQKSIHNFEARGSLGTKEGEEIMIRRLESSVVENVEKQLDIDQGPPCLTEIREESRAGKERFDELQDASYTVTSSKQNRVTEIRPSDGHIKMNFKCRQTHENGSEVEQDSSTPNGKLQRETDFSPYCVVSDGELEGSKYLGTVRTGHESFPEMRKKEHFRRKRKHYLHGKKAVGSFRRPAQNSWTQLKKKNRTSDELSCELESTATEAAVFTKPDEEHEDETVNKNIGNKTDTSLPYMGAYRCCMKNCSKICLQKVSMLEHLHHHFKYYPYVCSQCRYTSCFERAIKRHVTGVHENAVLINKFDPETEEKLQILLEQSCISLNTGTRRHRHVMPKEAELDNSLDQTCGTDKKSDSPKDVVPATSHVTSEQSDSSKNNQDVQDIEQAKDLVSTAPPDTQRRENSTTLLQASVTGESLFNTEQIKEGSGEMDTWQSDEKMKNNSNMSTINNSENVLPYSKFRCYFRKCHRTFTSQHNLKFHMEAHLNYFKYSCSLCRYSSQIKGNIKYHIKKVHPKGNILEQADEAKEEELKSLLDYTMGELGVEAHGPKVNYKTKRTQDECPNSNLTCNLPVIKSVQKDLINADSTVAPIVQNGCIDEIFDKDNFDHIPDKSAALTYQAVQISPSGPPIQMKESHDKPSSTSRIEAPESDKKMKGRSELAAVNITEDVQHVCILRCYFQNCHKIFTSRSSLKFHLQAHLNYFKYSCSLCGYSSQVKTNVKNHIKQLHTKDSILEQDDEGKEEEVQALLKEYCSMSKVSHETHNLIGKNNKKKIADGCSNSNLANGSTERENDTSESDEKMKNESEGAAVSASEDVLPSSGFRCYFQECHATYSSRLNLKFHIESHVNYFKFSCSFCGYSSHVKTNVKHHIGAFHEKDSILAQTDEAKEKEVQALLETYCSMGNLSHEQHSLKEKENTEKAPDDCSNLKHITKIHKNNNRLVPLPESSCSDESVNKDTPGNIPDTVPTLKSLASEVKSCLQITKYPSGQLLQVKEVDDEQWGHQASFASLTYNCCFDNCRSVKPLNNKKSMRLHLLSHFEYYPYSCNLCDLKFKQILPAKQHTMRCSLYARVVTKLDASLEEEIKTLLKKCCHNSFIDESPHSVKEYAQETPYSVRGSALEKPHSVRESAEETPHSVRESTQETPQPVRESDQAVSDSLEECTQIDKNVSVVNEEIQDDCDSNRREIEMEERRIVVGDILGKHAAGAPSQEMQSFEGQQQHFKEDSKPYGDSSTNQNRCCFKTCKKNFFKSRNYRPNIRQHLQTHMEYYPYVCSHCDLKFKCKSIGVRHIRRCSAKASIVANLDPYVEKKIDSLLEKCLVESCLAKNPPAEESVFDDRGESGIAENVLEDNECRSLTLGDLEEETVGDVELCNKQSQQKSHAEDGSEHVTGSGQKKPMYGATEQQRAPDAELRCISKQKKASRGNHVGDKSQPVLSEINDNTEIDFRERSVFREKDQHITSEETKYTENNGTPDKDQCDVPKEVEPVEMNSVSASGNSPVTEEYLNSFNGNQDTHKSSKEAISSAVENVQYFEHTADFPTKHGSSEPVKDKEYTCCFENCGKSCNGAYYMLVHLQSHLRYLPHTCPYCDFRSEVASNVMQHVRLRHTGKVAEVRTIRDQQKEKEVEILLEKSCCDKKEGFSTSRMKSAISRNYTCCFKECGKSYKLKSQMRYHLKSHIGYLPYSCLKCEFRSCRPNKISQHCQYQCQYRKTTKIKPAAVIDKIKEQELDILLEKCKLDSRTPSLFEGKSGAVVVLDTKTNGGDTNENRDQIETGKCQMVVGDLQEHRTSVLGSHDVDADLSENPRVEKQDNGLKDCDGETDVMVENQLANTNISGDQSVFVHRKDSSASKKPRSKKYTCCFERCRKSYCSKRSMVLHLYYHLEYSPYMCPHCKFRSRFNHHVLWHIRTKHEDIMKATVQTKVDPVREKEVQTLWEKCKNTALTSSSGLPNEFDEVETCASKVLAEDTCITLVGRMETEKGNTGGGDLGDDIHSLVDAAEICVTKKDRVVESNRRCVEGTFASHSNDVCTSTVGKGMGRNDNQLNMVLPLLEVMDEAPEVQEKITSILPDSGEKIGGVEISHNVGTIERMGIEKETISAVSVGTEGTAEFGIDGATSVLQSNDGSTLVKEEESLLVCVDISEMTGTEGAIASSAFQNQGEKGISDENNLSLFQGTTGKVILEDERNDRVLGGSSAGTEGNADVNVPQMELEPEKCSKVVQETLKDNLYLCSIESAKLQKLKTKSRRHAKAGCNDLKRRRLSQKGNENGACIRKSCIEQNRQIGKERSVPLRKTRSSRGYKKTDFGRKNIFEKEHKDNIAETTLCKAVSDKVGTSAHTYNDKEGPHEESGPFKRVSTQLMDKILWKRTRKGKREDEMSQTSLEDGNVETDTCPKKKLQRLDTTDLQEAEKAEEDIRYDNQDESVELLEGNRDESVEGKSLYERKTRKPEGKESHKLDILRHPEKATEDVGNDNCSIIDELVKVGANRDTPSQGKVPHERKTNKGQKLKKLQKLDVSNLLPGLEKCDGTGNGNADQDIGNIRCRNIDELIGLGESDRGASAHGKAPYEMKANKRQRCGSRRGKRHKRKDKREERKMTDEEMMFLSDKGCVDLVSSHVNMEDSSSEGKRLRVLGKSERKEDMLEVTHDLQTPIESCDVGKNSMDTAVFSTDAFEKCGPPSLKDKVSTSSALGELVVDGEEESVKTSPNRGDGKREAAAEEDVETVQTSPIRDNGERDMATETSFRDGGERDSIAMEDMETPLIRDSGEKDFAREDSEENNLGAWEAWTSETSEDDVDTLQYTLEERTGKLLFEKGADQSVMPTTYKCRFCQFSTISSSLALHHHFAKHKEHAYKAKKVKIKTPDDKKLGKGKDGTDTGTTSIYRCGWCKFCASTPVEVIQHQEKKHKDGEQDIIKLPTNSKPLGKSKVKVEFCCGYCKYSAHLRRKVAVHCQLRHKGRPHLLMEKELGHSYDVIDISSSDESCDKNSSGELTNEKSNKDPPKEDMKLKMEAKVVCSDFLQCDFLSMDRILTTAGVSVVNVDVLYDNEFVDIAKRYVKERDITYMDSNQALFCPVNLAKLDKDDLEKTVKECGSDRYLLQLGTGYIK